MTNTARFLNRVTERDAWRFTAWTFAISLLVMAFGLIVVSQFGFDSWSVFELSRTPGQRFFEANTSRTYANDSLYSTAFAPFWPLAVALFSLFAENIYGSYIASFACYIGFALAAEKLGRRAFGFRGVGMLSALILLRFVGVRTELGAGRSIPLFLLEVALIGCFLFNMKNASPRRAFAIGILSGAMIMSRFDAIPSAMVALTAMPFLGMRPRRYALVLLGFGLTILPWVFYSAAHFQTLFATDMRAVALAVEPNSFVLDYNPGPSRTLFNAPLLWFGKLFSHLPGLVTALGLSIAWSIFIPLVLLLAFQARHNRDPHPLRVGDMRPRGLVVLTLICVAPLSGYLVTGYTEYRYFSATVWVIEFLTLGYIARGDARRWNKIAITLAVLGGFFSLAVLRHSVTTNPFAIARRELDRKDIDVLVSCLERAEGGKSDPVLFREGRPVDPIKFGALTGWRVLTLPSNWSRLNHAKREEFLHQYRAEFVVGNAPVDEVSLIQGAAPVACPVPLRHIGNTRF